MFQNGIQNVANGGYSPSQTNNSNNPPYIP
jgi:hypothetical protein